MKSELRYWCQFSNLASISQSLARPVGFIYCTCLGIVQSGCKALYEEGLEERYQARPMDSKLELKQSLSKLSRVSIIRHPPRRVRRQLVSVSRQWRPLPLQVLGEVLMYVE